VTQALAPGSRWLPVAIGGLTGLVFVIDLLTPLGRTEWVLYVLPLILTAWVGRVSVPLLYAAIVMVLLAAGFLFSPAGVAPSLALGNRALGALVLWGAAFLIWRYQARRDAALEQERSFRLLFEANPQPMWVHDTGTQRFLATNDAAIAQYGWSREEFLGMTVADIGPAEDETRVLAAVTGEGTAAAWCHRVRDGRTIDVELSSNALKFAGHDARLVLAADVTHRRQNEEALRRSEAQLRSFIEQAPVAIAMFDRDMRYLVASRRWLADYHLDGRSLIGLSHYEIFPEIPERWRLAHRRGLGGEVLREKEDGFQRADGSVQWLRWELRPWYETDGTIGGIVILTEDITERKEQELELQRSREQLRALAARQDRLLEEERTRISREIHDEFGQMLTGIKMDLRSVERRLDEQFSDDPRVNPLLDRLAAAGELADATMQSMQRIAAELRPGMLDRLGLGAALEFEAARFTERYGIPCRVVLPEPPPPLSVQVSTMLFRIFQEALTNIARHSGASTVDVEFSDDHGCCLEIRDDGRGLTATALTGFSSLGLAGMRERARLIGGEIAFTPRPGGGLVVTARAPCLGSLDSP
jgi:PAS domain S-box-containing protein